MNEHKRWFNRMTDEQRYCGQSQFNNVAVDRWFMRALSDMQKADPIGFARLQFKCAIERLSEFGSREPETVPSIEDRRG